ncbi:peptidoglycan D,D-transpeptidase FtsI family protein [Paenibacillus camelliae]|uniref:peptidoglycan D,D-transpeptidase FtsI family protein n=1 Tax=Paenibacillus camelliae TaxID=512410 RepID=UPI00203D39EC|nr:penicillin-binding protein 2 [Paenibacillus camelliae]MCM3632383.1 penicillin-binding protein 2 [Paenibacillus camelliae]
MHKRALIVGIGFTCLMFIYIARLMIVQIIPTAINGSSVNNKYKEHNWKATAVTQRTKQLQLDDGRAVFLDQHEQPLQTERYKTIAFFPIKRWDELTLIEATKLGTILDRAPSELMSWVKELKFADFIYDDKHLPVRLTEQQIRQLSQLDQEGFEVVDYTARNGHNDSYRHVIGFIGEHPEWVEQRYRSEIDTLKNWDRNSKVGVSGLEHSLDRILHGLGPTYISYTLDGQSRYMAGIGARFIAPNNPYYPLHVVTTLDLELQSSIEKLMDERNVAEGAVVLLDASNGDIKAMVSRPRLQPESWANIDNNSWRNHALTAYEPGSIYKIVTAAAALEYGVVTEDEQFHCSGEYGKYGLSCWKKGGHGKQTLADAFANSCNIVFATLAERLTSQQLHDTAAALGVIHPVGWHNDQRISPLPGPMRLLEEEEAGTAVHDVLTRDGGIMAQTGIGQRDVRLTPLQAANMIVTILNGGLQYETRVVSSINYADGIPVIELPVHIGHEHKYRIHPSTAHRLRYYMEQVTARGTAAYLQGGAWSLAGKTGTAQLSGNLDGYNNQWFTGYAPADKPRYAAAVLLRKTRADSKNKAASLFQEVMELAAEHELKEQGHSKK